jgi:hypothetical protein
MPEGAVYVGEEFSRKFLSASTGALISGAHFSQELRGEILCIVKRGTASDDGCATVTVLLFDNIAKKRNGFGG